MKTLELNENYIKYLSFSVFSMNKIEKFCPKRVFFQKDKQSYWLRNMGCLASFILFSTNWPMNDVA